MTYRTEPASQLTLMASAGRQPPVSCTFGDPGNFILPSSWQGGWAPGGGWAAQTLYSSTFSAAVVSEVIPSAGPVPDSA